MLIEFSVKNFRSIKDEVTLSMVPSNYDKSLQKNIINIKQIKMLRTAAIFGANASGKSNLLHAINNMVQMVNISPQLMIDDKIPFYQPFKFYRENKKPTTLNVILFQDGVKYVYEFSYDDREIISEYCFIYKSSKSSTLFERGKSRDLLTKQSNIKRINDYYYYFPKQFINRFSVIAENTNTNCLLLSRSAQMSFKEIFPIINWFRKINFFDAKFDGSFYTTHRANKNEFFKKKVLSSLNSADFAIQNLSFKKLNEIKEEDAETIQNKKFLTVLNFNPLKKNQMQKIQVSFIHNNREFTLSEESEGTKKMYSIIGPILDILENGKILIFDELDVKLHPKLMIFIIALFNNPKINSNNAQLIFSTHNTNLLNSNLFRRDQIWFTEKDINTFSTSLYSLLEFKQRKDSPIEKYYLDGRYGAIPYINLEDLEQWFEDSNQKEKEIQDSH